MSRNESAAGDWPKVQSGDNSSRSDLEVYFTIAAALLSSHATILSQNVRALIPNRCVPIAMRSARAH
ncbi:hypothetical protein VTH06DRAFT_2070 [Thermothelomyces fergusii]